MQKDQPFPMECCQASSPLASGIKSMALPEIQRGTYTRAGNNKQHFKMEQNHLEKL